MQDDDEFLPTRRVRARYGGKSEKTIDRWVKSGVLPLPDYMMVDALATQRACNSASAKAWRDGSNNQGT